MDSLSEEVGVRPNIPWLFFKDPTLALQVFFRTLHTIPIPSDWTRKVGWSPSGYPHSVGPGVSAF